MSGRLEDVLAQKLRVQQEFGGGPAAQAYGVEPQGECQLAGLGRRGQETALFHALDRVWGHVAGGGQIGRAQAEGAAARREEGWKGLGLRYVCTHISIITHTRPSSNPKLANIDDIRPQFQVSNDLTTDQTGAFSSNLIDGTGAIYPVNGLVDTNDNTPLAAVQGFKQLSLPWYADQCLPFDITIAAANEYGAAASAKLFGVEILNEGFGTSVDDSVLEQQATFIARSVLPLQAVGRIVFQHQKRRVNT